MSAVLPIIGIINHYKVTRTLMPYRYSLICTKMQLEFVRYITIRWFGWLICCISWVSNFHLAAWEKLEISHMLFIIICTTPEVVNTFHSFQYVKCYAILVHAFQYIKCNIPSYVSINGMQNFHMLQYINPLGYLLDFAFHSIFEI